MSELTRDRVERAIADLQFTLSFNERWLGEIPEEQRQSDFYKDAIQNNQSLSTCLAALEAVRWRDATVEWPEEEMHMVVKISFISVPIVAYKPEKSEHVQLPNSYGAEYSRSVIKKYLPLPKWEEEAINRAFDDEHRGIGLTD
jgi:hypothetical protein